MLAGISDGKSSLSRQSFHGALTVGEDVDDLEPAAVRQRLRQSRELIEERRLSSAAIPFAGGLACLGHGHTSGQERRLAAYSTN